MCGICKSIFTFAHLLSQNSSVPQLNISIIFLKKPKIQEKLFSKDKGHNISCNRFLRNITETQYNMVYKYNTYKTEIRINSFPSF